MPIRRSPYTRIGSVFGLLLVGLIAMGTLGTGAVGASAVAASGVGASAVDVSAVDDFADEPLTDITLQSQNVSEEPYVEPVPEPGDPYYEAEAADGSWISYVNPRDEYRSPYLGPGSGKVCVSLYDADGNVIVGESIPDTTVTVPIGDSLSWHSGADPMTVEYPLTEHYDRPLDADQFGTNPDLPQGDGYLDSHCIEWHGMDEESTVEYGEAEIEGEYADRIEVVGYHQQDFRSWESDVDPIEDAVTYEDAGGGWTYDPDHSHGQVVVVLQLEGDADEVGESDDGDENETADGNGNETADDGERDTADQGDDGASNDTANGESDSADSEGDGETNESDETADEAYQEANERDESADDDENDPVPGLGVAAALFALAVAILLSKRK